MPDRQTERGRKDSPSRKITEAPNRAPGVQLTLNGKAKSLRESVSRPYLPLLPRPVHVASDRAILAGGALSFVILLGATALGRFELGVAGGAVMLLVTTTVVTRPSNQ